MVPATTAAISTARADVETPSLWAGEGQRVIRLPWTALDAPLATARCAGCGARGTHACKRLTALPPLGLWRGLLFLLLGPVLTFAVLFLTGVACVALAIALDAQPPSWAVALSFLFSVVGIGAVAHAVGRAIQRPKIASFPLCRRCRLGHAATRGTLAVFALVAMVLPMASLGFTLGAWRELLDGDHLRAATWLTGLSGVGFLLWLAPLYRAAERRVIQLGRSTREGVELRVPATFLAVVVEERPELASVVG